MAEVHQKYDFIDSPDPFWDGHDYVGESTDEIGFFEYANQLKTTEGFHVDRVPEIFWTSIVPENVDSQYTIEAANKAVKEFNRLKGADLKLSKILNANCLITSSALYFLTLQCSDDFFYEAKIDMFIDEGCKLVMFRPAKYWPREDKNSLDTSSAVRNLNETFEENVTERVKLEQGNGSAPIGEINSSANSNLVIEKKTEILTAVVFDKNSDLVDEEAEENFADPQLKSSNNFTTEGDTAINAPSGKSNGNYASREQVRTPEAIVSENEANVQGEVNSHKGSNSTLDRINLASWKGAWKGAWKESAEKIILKVSSWKGASKKFAEKIILKLSSLPTKISSSRRS